MPVTPFHFGIGLLSKSLVPRRVSLTGFCVAQVAIDFESGYFLFRHEWPAHRFCHTLLGATLVCSVAVLVTMPALRVLTSWLRRDADPEVERWLALRAPSTRGVIITTIALAVVGHVLPDAVMHSDMHPFAPLTNWNPVYATLPLSHLHLALVLAGAFGVLLASARHPVA